MENSPLRELHRSLGARFEEGQGARILSYGEPLAEYEALRLSCGLVDRSGRGVLRLTGSERASFVHRLVTNDVEKLPVGRARYAAALTVKGHLIADLRVLKRADDMLVDCDAGRGAAVSEFFNRYLISEDVEVQDVSNDFAVLSFVGPRAFDALGAALGQPVGALEEDAIGPARGGAVMLGTRLGGAPGADLFVPAAEARAVFEAALERGRGAGLRPVGEDALEIVRVEAGQPRYGADMGEETIPLEASLERAISYDKGCYVGQEVIARASFRGQVRRKLTGLSFDPGALPARGTQLFKAAGDAKAAAEVTTAVQSPRFGVIALGYVRREHLAQGTELRGADGRLARVTALPFWRGGS